MRNLFFQLLFPKSIIQQVLESLDNDLIYGSEYISLQSPPPPLRKTYLVPPSHFTSITIGDIFTIWRGYQLTITFHGNLLGGYIQVSNVYSFVDILIWSICDVSNEKGYLERVLMEPKCDKQHGRRIQCNRQRSSN